MTLQPWLREILRCPACRAELRDITADGADTPTGLACTGPDCGLVYRIDEGIPVLLVDEAEPGGGD